MLTLSHFTKESSHDASFEKLPPFQIKIKSFAWFSKRNCNENRHKPPLFVFSPEIPIIFCVLQKCLRHLNCNYEILQIGNPKKDFSKLILMSCPILLLAEAQLSYSE